MYWIIFRLCPQTTCNSGEEQVVSPLAFLKVHIYWSIYSNAPKYRLVVRFTNKDIICQIVYARLQGDFVLTSARAKELPKYGINHGLTNWSAGWSLPQLAFCGAKFWRTLLAYATGLLVACQALTKLGLADKYEGITDPDSTYPDGSPPSRRWRCPPLVQMLSWYRSKMHVDRVACFQCP